MSSPLASARSLLFVPASRPERFARALDAGAGCVILDLEDAVAPAGKAAARTQLDDHLGGFAADQLARTLVRINAGGTEWHEDDLRLLARWCAKGLAGAMVPKAESGAALDAIAAALGPAAQLVPLIESLAGLDAVDALARAPQVARLAFGHLDFQLDLGMKCGADEAELAAVRFALAAASRRAQLPAPIDGVTVDTADGERLRQDARRARAFGFGAKLCIHPAQVAIVDEVFAPSAAEIEWARRVIEVARASGGQVASLDGKMVDLPVIRLAEQTLRQAGTVAAASSPAAARAT
ncbi:HpcH/HpaI aldolase/citrate lyase family protein [Variovorax sp. JS1663]|uniref:HpcH/HpaI aldolase/citrate lyase family protein n=1 Tax=Variovorax sp. JS1663 TaxID=1851577 RepID=UPI000B347F8F|nr:CoA ester lyase [Variovorax sp. JS1663]OUL99798.1 citryl-CoA lyase [Variovorax sp. JS1663]